LTQVYDARRLAWRLDGQKGATRLATFFDALGRAGEHADRASLEKLAGALKELDAGSQPAAAPTPAGARAAGTAPDAPVVTSARALPPSLKPAVVRAARDLAQLLAASPDASIGKDWALACHALAAAITTPPEETLAKVERLIATLRHKDRARLWMVGSAAHQAAVMPSVDALVASLDASPTPRARHEARPLALTRARERGADVNAPAFVSLVERSLSRASLWNSAPVADLNETRDDALVDLLAAHVFNGDGTHSFYKRIWGAGLAYSGYANASARSGRMELYTDRCADLAELVRFTDKDVRAAPTIAGLVDYAVANELYGRVGSTYETRARAIAVDLVEESGPDVMRAFRQRLLGLRTRPGIADAVHARVLPVYAQVIPTLPDTTPAKDLVMFAVGPEPLLADYEKELRAARGAKTSMLRLYARDFWDTK
jgi:hypothetical protein